MKLPGRMGRERTTVLSQKLVKVDKERQLLLVCGGVPGVRNGRVIIRVAVKK